MIVLDVHMQWRHDHTIDPEEDEMIERE